MMNKNALRGPNEEAGRDTNIRSTSTEWGGSSTGGGNANSTSGGADYAMEVSTDEREINGIFPATATTGINLFQMQAYVAWQDDIMQPTNDPKAGQLGAVTMLDDVQMALDVIDEVLQIINSDEDIICNCHNLPMAQ